MNILLVDDEPLVLEELKYLCRGIDGATVRAAFTDPAQALDFAAHEPVDIAFLDIRLPGLSGLQLLRQLRLIHPTLQAVFVTAYEEYAMDAWREEACGYLLKPFGPDQVRRALDRARQLRISGGQDRVLLRTFGRFDLFHNGQAVTFRNRKARELLALLTVRWGGTVSMELAIESLWEGAPYADPVKVKYRKALMNLRETLAAHGLLWMLRSARGQLWLEPTGIECDYFRLLSGDREAALHFQGQFLLDYSWGEFYLPRVEQLAKALRETGQAPSQW